MDITVPPSNLHSIAMTVLCNYNLLKAEVILREFDIEQNSTAVLFDMFRNLCIVTEKPTRYFEGLRLVVHNALCTQPSVDTAVRNRISLDLPVPCR
jgi:hypothetical protein